MARFHRLCVTDIKKTTRDAVVVTLLPETPDLFAFVPGQYLTFRRTFAGEELRRSYSICSAVGDPALQVGIKRVEGGAFSTWANQELEIGETLEAMVPMGQFHLPLSVTHQKHYLGFAGGSGITPVLSNLKSILHSEPNSRFTLVYANRNVNTIMFRQELEDLKNQYLGRFSVVHILASDVQEIDLFTGRIDQQKCKALFAAWIDIKSVSAALICGPEPMMLAIADSLKAHGLDKTQIKFELFASNKPRRTAKATTTGAMVQGAGASAKSGSSGAGANASVSARVVLDGASLDLRFDGDSSVLDALLAAGLDAPYACKAGVCSTCKCKVVAGEVEMVANHALEDDEVMAGYVLACQTHALSPTLELVFEDH